MTEISRRAFVRAGSLAFFGLGAEPLFLARAAFARQRPASGKTLVCLFQRGAVDGLSMVIPHGESAYYQDRPRIAVPKGDLLDLDGHFGLHPALAPLLPRWRAGELALVHAVGSPDSTRSHFDAQDFMETGRPGDRAERAGWANRFLAHRRAHRETPFRAVAFGPSLPLALAGSAPALAVDDLDTFGLRARTAAGSDRLTRAFNDLYQGAATGLLAGSSAEAFEAIRMLEAADPAKGSSAPGAEYPKGKLGQHLSQIARLIKANLGLELAFADVGGWDTHVNQGAAAGQLAVRLDELGRGLAAFAADLGERMRDVVVLTMSEFGRTVRENGTGGTDHGHATAMMVLGGGIRGGRVLGRWPGLTPEQRYEGRDLAVTTDFRALFGEVLTGHLGSTDLASVFPGFSGGAAVGLW